MDHADFAADRAGLQRALDLLVDRRPPTGRLTLPDAMPDHGVGPAAAMDALFAPVLDDSRDLAAPGVFGPMDPPTPWITWAMHLWTASRNQNLLHPDTAPVARELEARVVAWLAPAFGMSGGHLTPGSTLANLTAIWAAREAGATEVVASADAHLSIAKAAHLLAMPYRMVPSWVEPGDLRHAVAVLTAGTTSTGTIEPLDAAAGARWRHVDAAWAGPLRLSDRHRHLLDGIESADSVAVSAHKWLFQPKESALVLFADHHAAHASISFAGPYLTTPNIGVLGSHGATAVPLLATLLAYGRTGVAAMIDEAMHHADVLWELIERDPRLVARSAPRSGVVCWRHRSVPADDIITRLPAGALLSTARIDGDLWLRSVAANPMVDPHLVVSHVLDAAQQADHGRA